MNPIPPFFSMDMLTPTFIIFLVVGLKLLFCSLCVILARNPIHAVLFLIAAFLNTSVLFLLMGAEFLALIVAIVYVGAVAILFLFVVMMFDVSFDALKKRIQNFGVFVMGAGLFLMTELVIVFWTWKSSSKAKDIVSYAISEKVSNTMALGNVLYTDYFLAFQLSGIVLLIAMVGAIALTLQDKKTLKRQDVKRQLERNPSNTLRMVSIPSRQGVKNKSEGAKK